MSVGGQHPELIQWLGAALGPSVFPVSQAWACVRLSPPCVLAGRALSSDSPLPHAPSSSPAFPQSGRPASRTLLAELQGGARVGEGSLQSRPGELLSLEHLPSEWGSAQQPASPRGQDGHTDSWPPPTSLPLATIPTHSPVGQIYTRAVFTHRHKCDLLLPHSSGLKSEAG